MALVHPRMASGESHFATRECRDSPHLWWDRSARTRSSESSTRVWRSTTKVWRSTTRVWRSGVGMCDQPRECGDQPRECGDRVWECGDHGSLSCAFVSRLL